MKTRHELHGFTRIVLLLIGVCALLCGCANPKAAAFHTLKDTQISVDKAMTVYGQLCVTGKVSAENQQKIDAAHAQYRTAFRTAVQAAQLDYSKLTPDTVQSLADLLLTLIVQLQQ